MKRKDFSCLDGILSFIIFLCFLLYLFCSCSTHKVFVPPVVLNDSTRTLVEERIIDVKFTVHIDIPAQKASVTTRDSTSHLETDYAASDVHLHADGSFTHTLQNKEQQIEKEMTEKIPEKKVYVEKIKEVPVPAPYPVEKGLSWWQKLMIGTGCCCMLFLVLGALYKIARIARKI